MKTVKTVKTVKAVKAVKAAQRTSSQPDDTRQRILDVSLRLFTEQGFEKTSLREIADELGFTKAALYYHFPSKDDILLAVHLQLHALMDDAFGRLTEGPSNLESWARFLDDSITEMINHSDLIRFHERNRAALERLHDQGHTGEHQELEDQFRAMLQNSDLTVRDRVRMTCALGAVMGGIVMLGSAFTEADPEAVGTHLREVVDDLLTGSGR